MTKLTQKKVKFEWGDKQEIAFQLLKQKLCSAPILALPEGSEDFIDMLRRFKIGNVLLHFQIMVSNSNTHSTYSSWLESFFSAQGICHHVRLARVISITAPIQAYTLGPEIKHAKSQHKG
ncbi:hypothetical protein Tco_0245199 [Tanacetum coccineum]